jgi:hypothetical protein
VTETVTTVKIEARTETKTETKTETSETAGLAETAFEMEILSGTGSKMAAVSAATAAPAAAVAAVAEVIDLAHTTLPRQRLGTV